jgi:hypothetical protein
VSSHIAVHAEFYWAKSMAAWVEQLGLDCNVDLGKREVDWSCKLPIWC